MNYLHLTKMLFVYSVWSFFSANATVQAYELVPFSYEGQEKFARDNGVNSLPVVLHFNKNGKALQYIAAEHASGPRPTETEPGHPTFACVKRAFEEFNPDFCIVEGFDGEEQTRVRQQGLCSEDIGDSESGYTIDLARERRISFIGGEPTLDQSKKHILESGYSIDDLACLYITQYIGQDLRNPNGHLKNDELKLEPFVNMIGQSWLGLDKKYDFNSYRKIYESYGKPLRFEELKDTNITVPLSEGTKLQKIASVICVLRDTTILNRILEAMKKYSKVLVAYGGSHYYCQHSELERHFGKPRVEIQQLKSHTVAD